MHHQCRRHFGCKTISILEMGVSSAERIFFAIFFCFVGIFGLIANIAILVVLLKSKDYRKRPSTSYFYSLLISSILSSLYVLPYNTFSVVVQLPKPIADAYETECRTSLFFIYSITTGKIFVLVGMSLDRFMAVLYPYFYDARITRCKAKMINGLLWTVAIVITLPILAKGRLSRYKGKVGLICGVDWKVMKKGYFMFAMLLGFLLPFVVMMITNIKVFIVARKQKHLINKRYARYQLRGTEISLETGGSNSVIACNRELESIVNRNSEETCQMKNPSIFHGSSNLNACPTKVSKSSIFSVKKEPGTLDSLKGKLSNGSSFNIRDANDFSNAEHNNVEDEFTASNLTDNGNDSKFCEKLALPIEASHERTIIDKIIDDDDRNASDPNPVTRSKQYKLRSNSDVEWSIVFSTLFIVAAFFITWTPWTISRGIESFTRILEPRVALYTNAPTYLDVVVNPLIFIGTRYTLRTKLLNCLLCKG